MEEKQQDTRLLKRIAEGSQDAFDEFYEKYASFILHIAIQIVADKNEAEDVMHDIFLQVYEKPKQFNPKRGSMKAWLAVMTKNRCIDRLRKKKPVLVHKLEMLETEDDVKTELSVLMKIEKELIIDALKQIPEKQQNVIYGIYFQNMTQKELSKTLNKPLGTIKSLIRYGLRNMRKQKQLINWLKAGRGGGFK